MNRVPFRSFAGALRVAAGIAAAGAALISGEAWSAGPGQRWQMPLEKLRSLSVNDSLPSFARLGKPLRLTSGHPYLVSSKGSEIPATLFSAPDCRMAPGGRDIDCTDQPQAQSPLVAVLTLTKRPDRRVSALPVALMLVPQGAAPGSPDPSIRTLTPVKGQGLLTEDKFFWISIDREQDPRLAPVGVAFCLDECDTSGPLYTFNEALPGDSGQGAGAATSDRPVRTGLQLPPSEITVAVQNVPPQYSDKMVARLVLSAVRMRDGTSSSDIIGITPAAGTAQQKAVMLKVKGSAVDGLTVAGERSDCLANPRCEINLTLRPRYVDPGSAGAVRLIAGVRPGAEPPDPFYRRLGLNNIELPAMTQGAPPGYAIVHLLDDSYFQIYFKAGRTTFEGRNAPFVDVPRFDEARNLLRLTLPERRPPVLAAVEDGLPQIGSAGPNPGRGQPPQTLMSVAAAPSPAPPPSAPPPAGDQTAAGLQTGTPPASVPEPAVVVHYVLKPAADPALPGWTESRLAKRLVELLRGTQFLLKDGDPSSRPPELVPSDDAVVVWSGNRPQGTPEWVLSRPVEGVTITPQIQAPQTVRSGWPGSRIRTNDAVAIGEFRIDRPYLYDQWQAGIEAVRKVNDQESPDASNELCSFSLNFNGSNEQFRLVRSEQTGKRILLSEPISPPRFKGLLNLPAQLEVQNNDANATCAAQRTPLGVLADGWKTSESPASPSTGLIETRIDLVIRGRWLLGLYGPQSIGAGLDDASDLIISDAKDDIVNSFIRFLDKVRKSDFQDSQPIVRAVGYDLALLNGADTAAPGFAERSVLSGGYRQPKTDLFQLDNEGVRRLNDFLAGPSSSGSAADFQQVGEKIIRYSRLFGELSGESRPVAIYVGAAPSLRNLCSTWKDMTREVAGLSGTPRVFGIVFANASAGQIDSQLERNLRGAPRQLGLRVRGLTCEGENKSMALVVPFPDLVSRDPKTIVGPAFDVVQQWMAN